MGHFTSQRTKHAESRMGLRHRRALAFIEELAASVDVSALERRISGM